MIAGVSSHPSASDFQLKGVEYLHFVIPQKSVQIIGECSIPFLPSFSLTHSPSSTLHPSEKHDHLPPPSNSESPESVILIREKAEAQRSANEQKEGGGESLLSEIAHRVLFMFESAVATTTVTGKKNWAAALRTSKEALSAFIGVSEEKIKEVLIDDGVRCPEENVFIACLCWAQNKVKSDDPEVLR